MYKVPQVTESIYYVGVNDRNKPLFENMWSLPHGVSYNSYLIMDEEVVLVDTVDIAFADVFFHKLESILQGRVIDYLVVNHMEPDHSGAISLLRQRYPNIKIVGNKKTMNMLEGYYGIIDNVVEVGNGTALRTGKHEFSFLMAPMVHWPEVMFTYEQTDKVLFSADAFGTFGTLDGHVFDRDTNLDHYLSEMYRYYACIVGKYGNFVQKVLDNIKKMPIEIDYICSTHGVVWTQAHFAEAFTIYDRMSRYEAEEGAVIIYGSMYGHTEQLADAIASSIAEGGIREVVCHNVSSTDPSIILRDIFKYKAVVIGSPTYCNGIFTPIENILNMIRVREVKNRIYSSFGSFSWSGQAVKKLAPFAEEMHWESVGTAVEMKMAGLDAVLDDAWALGQAVAERLKADRINK
ncbi:FprA family A-type flavoprotein [Porphyromonas pogonae]|uniref:FprA family A-type flavoprotein n=1 Tax=Porphyromonas pogonae TaxID=867595 RepID=UPI002E79523C|nr:FprA family A-type flavoprotein [Porphyromonas pogonae]